MIDGLSHITFIVSDLDKMEVILMKVLDEDQVTACFRTLPKGRIKHGQIKICDLVVHYDHLASMFQQPTHCFHDAPPRVMKRGAEEDV